MTWIVLERRSHRQTERRIGNPSLRRWLFSCQAQTCEFLSAGVQFVEWEFDCVSLNSQVQWVTGMANNHRLFVTVNSPQGVLVASHNEAIGQLKFQTELTGRINLHHPLYALLYISSKVTVVSSWQVFTECVLGTTTTNLEESGSFWALGSSTKDRRNQREIWRKSTKSSTALWLVLRYESQFKS